MEKSTEGTPAPVATTAEAEAIFQKFWTETVVPAATGEAAMTQLDSLVQAQRPSVTSTTQEQYLAQVNAALGASGNEELILHGTRDSLRQGKCWSVHYDGLLSTGLGACIDAATGQVLFVWETPEG